MGIHGIYKEIGPGKRVALSKLAVEKFEATGRPLRIAIDTSIWLFQIQASKGGTNPALRTFYYRLLRLIALSIHPIFVFDGPNKPPFKRNKRTGPNVASIPEFLAKQLLKQFGFPIHLAPGEAEAECALLQREGIVDAVLSEDVDTLMFGSGITIRNWSPEKTGKTPTHVNVYDAVETKNGPSGLDREGMILVALMSGGDYVPEGIPGCGPKTACEAARAGFGSDLCKISKGDISALTEWRERLRYELKTNASKFFKRKHAALKIPDDFPRVDILGYYTHPAISTQAGLDKLRRGICWDQELDFPGLRDFTYDAFDWVKLEGAKHFVRSLAPCLLVRKLRMRAEQLDQLPSSDLQAIQEDESLLIKGIHGKRQHPVTDNSTELRVSFTPIELVKIDLSKEEPDEDPERLPPNSQVGDVDLDDDIPLDIDDDGPKKRGPTKFDPENAARVWVLESFVKVGVPLKVQDWEAERQTKLKPRRAIAAQDPRNASKPRSGAKRTKTAGDMTQAFVERFAKVTKPGLKNTRASTKAKDTHSDMPLPVSQLVAPPQPNIVDLLSSPHIHDRNTASRSLFIREGSPTPVLQELPSSVTKRRRRRPIQRSQTLPVNASNVFDRASTPPLLDTIETLDLVSSPLPSLSRVYNKEAKIGEPNAASMERSVRGTSVASPRGNSKQPTLDMWRASATPRKLRDDPAMRKLSPTLLRTRSSGEDIDTLDLTLSSPQRPVLLRTQNGAPKDSGKPPPKSKVRRPLASRSPNASSSISQSTTAMKKSAKDIFTATQSRRTSPRLHKTVSAPLAANDNDLLLPSRGPSRSIRASPEVDTLDLTGSSSPASRRVSKSHDTLERSIPLSLQRSKSPSQSLHYSPPAHKSTSSGSSLPISPSAAWKDREKKKRQIILRKSLAGAWDFVETDSSPGASPDVVLKGKARRAWRESEVEVLDLS